LESIIRNVSLGIAFFISIAFASNRASAYFVYDFGRMYDAQLNNEKINLNAKILYQNSYFFNWNATDIEGDGGKVILLSVAKPVNINSVILEPSFLYANGTWDRGDFSYFYGKPNLPKALGFGMSIYYGHNSLIANYILCNGKILNNSGEVELFNSDFYLYNIIYKFSAIKNLNLYAGFTGLNAEAAGALTAANQQYFLFPYSFYEANGRLNVKFVHGLANFTLESNSVEYGIDVGALVAVYENIKGNLHYKYRKFFGTFYGTEEIYEDFYPVPMKGSGIVFSILSIKTKKIKFGENYIQYGVQKPLALPFGRFFYEEPYIDDGGSSSGGGEGIAEESESVGKLIKDALLWGLTASVNVYF